MNRETIKEILPIGSVVTLQGGTKKIMIIGRIQEENATGVSYDYSAVYYPEGIIDPNELFLFQHTDIDLIYFVGLQESEEFAFRSFMEQRLKEMNRI